MAYAHAQSPVRVGIAGGGTDLPAWTRDRVGRCLSVAIKAYTHAVAISRPDGQVVAAYRERDVATAATEIANGLIRESALLHGWEDSFEVHTLSELSSRGSGLGVSSSIAVSLAACFQRLTAVGAPERIREDAVDPLLVARDAWTVEIDRLRRPIGRQDHMAAAHGGLRLYRFEGQDATVERSFSAEDAAWVASHLCLVKLVNGHDSRAILSGVKSIEHLEMAAIAVDRAVIAIDGRDVEALGRALNRGQHSKVGIRGAVPDDVAAIVSRILSVPGVHGCKVAGAGGGGHLVVACERQQAEAIADATKLETVMVEADCVGVRSEGWR